MEFNEKIRGALTGDFVIAILILNQRNWQLKSAIDLCLNFRSKILRFNREAGR